MAITCLWCLVVRCPALNVSHGNVSTTATVYGSRVTIHCHVGYRIDSVVQQTVSCNQTGHWVPSDVICKRIVSTCILLFIVAENIL